MIAPATPLDPGVVAYGAGCAWWGLLSEARNEPDELSRCPHCGGLVYLIESEEAFFKTALEHERSGYPGWPDFLRWSRGKCFESWERALQLYEQATGVRPAEGA